MTVFKKQYICDLQDNCLCIDCTVYLLSLSSVISLLEQKSRFGQTKSHWQQGFWGQAVPWTITETFVCFPTAIAATVWKTLQRVFEPKITICIPGWTICHYKTQGNTSKDTSSLEQLWISLALRSCLRRSKADKNPG